MIFRNIILLSSLTSYHSWEKYNMLSQLNNWWNNLKSEIMITAFIFPYFCFISLDTLDKRFHILWYTYMYPSTVYINFKQNLFRAIITSCEVLKLLKKNHSFCSIRNKFCSRTLFVRFGTIFVCVQFCSIWYFFTPRRRTKIVTKLLLGPLSIARGQKGHRIFVTFDWWSEVMKVENRLASRNTKLLLT